MTTDIEDPGIQGRGAQKDTPPNPNCIVSAWEDAEISPLLCLVPHTVFLPLTAGRLLGGQRARRRYNQQ